MGGGGTGLCVSAAQDCDRRLKISSGILGKGCTRSRTEGVRAFGGGGGQAGQRPLAHVILGACFDSDRKASQQEAALRFL